MNDSQTLCFNYLIFGSLYLVNFKYLGGKRGFFSQAELSRFAPKLSETNLSKIINKINKPKINKPSEGQPAVPRDTTLTYFAEAFFKKNKKDRIELEELRKESAKYGEEAANNIVEKERKKRVGEYFKEIKNFFVDGRDLFKKINNFFLNPNELSLSHLDVFEHYFFTLEGYFSTLKDNSLEIEYSNKLEIITKVLIEEKKYRSHNDKEINEQVITDFFYFSHLALKYLALGVLKENKVNVDKYIDQDWLNYLLENMSNSAIICSQVTKKDLSDIERELTGVIENLITILKPNKTNNNMTLPFKCIWKLDSETIEITFNSREPSEIFNRLKSRQHKEEQPIWIKCVGANYVIISSFPDNNYDYSNLAPKIDDFGSQGGLEKVDDADNENTFKCDLKRLETFLSQRGKDTANFNITIKLDSDFDLEDIVNIFAVVKKVQEVGEGAIWLDKTTDDDEGYLTLDLETYPIVVERLYTLHKKQKLSNLLGFEVVNLDSDLLVNVLGVKDKISQPNIVIPAINKENINTAINLRQWLQNDFSQAVALGWQEVKKLINFSFEKLAFNTMNKSRAERAKLIDLGVQLGNKKVVLMIVVIPKKEDKISISIKVFPYKKEEFLPPNLKLVMLSPKGKVIVENQSRNLDNVISLPTLPPIEQGMKFKIQLSLGEANVILHNEDFIS